MLTQMGIVDTKHSSKLVTTKKCETLSRYGKLLWIHLSMHKDLRKFCSENYPLFVQGNGIEDETSIGCGENVNKVKYIPYFNFEGKI